MLEEKLAQYLDTIVKASTKFSPQVIDFAIRNERWDGMICIFYGIVSLVITIICVRWLLRSKDYWEEIGCDFPALGLSNTLIAICFGVASCINLLNVWNWVAIFSPKIAIGHDLVSKLLAQ